MVNAAILEKRLKQSGEYGLFSVTSAPNLKTQPTILVLPGSGSINNINRKRNENVSGTMRYVQHQEYMLLGSAYSSTTEVERTTKEYTQTDTLSWSSDIQDIVEDILAPNIPHLNIFSGEERAARLVDTFMALRNLKLFSNSHGGLAHSHLNNALNSLMEIRGFSKEEKSFLIPQIMHLGVAEIDSVKHEAQKGIPLTMSFAIKAFDDDILDDYGGFSEVESEIRLRTDGKPAMLRHGDNRLTLYANHPAKKLDNYGYRHKKCPHNIKTYLDAQDDVASEDDLFPNAFKAMWNSMTDLNFSLGMQDIVGNCEITAIEQWRFLNQHYGNPLQEILEHAQAKHEFSTIINKSTQFDKDNLPSLSSISKIPHYYSDKNCVRTGYAVSMDHTLDLEDLSASLAFNTNNINPDIVHFLLTAPFDYRDAGGVLGATSQFLIIA
jgi:hypothetical protein